MNIQETLKKYNKIEIELLLAEVLKKPKEFLFMNPEVKLSSLQAGKLTSFVKRRVKGEPIAYILGYKDFYGLRFKVNKNVLIPRPETEELLNIVIASASEAISNIKKIAASPDKALAPRNDRKIRILDVGTGSGCIIISLARSLQYLKNCANAQFFRKHELEYNFYGSDISTNALAVAKRNAKTHKVKIDFIKSNLLKNIKFSPDIIVANLPYVPRKIYDLRFKDLRFEPKGALVDPKKDFDLYDKLLSQISSLPSLPQVIFLEIDPKQKKLLPKVIKKYLPTADVKFHKDFNSLWRFVEITF